LDFLAALGLPLDISSRFSGDVFKKPV
jgi:hypothetical protein